MSPSDLPKFWTEPTKLGTFLENKVRKKFLKKIIKVRLLVQYSSKNFLGGERFNQFSTLKDDFESHIFEMFKEVVHNFGKSDGDII